MVDLDPNITRRPRVDIAGKRYGRVLIERFAGWYKTRGGREIPYYWAKCDCGKRFLKSGNAAWVSVSCGCLAIERLRQSCLTHGHTIGRSMTPTYRKWAAMMTRCFNPNVEKYAIYGGRGITVCPAWLTFDGFLRDMGESPSGMMLDRIDNDKGYGPENCRWVTPYESTCNRRCSRVIEFNGRRRLLTEWARDAGVSHSTLHRRLKAGWPMDQALSPVRFNSQRKPTLDRCTSITST